MVIYIYGVYRWARTRVGYRNDYCRRCEGQRISEQYRTFDCGHLYYIPLLPLGFRRRWHCTSCGSNPHEQPWGARQWFAFGAFFVGLFTFIIWLPIILGGIHDLQLLGTALCLTLAFCGLVYGSFRSKPRVKLREQLEQVPPLPRDMCFYCRGALDPEGRCAPCGVRHVPVL